MGKIHEACVVGDRHKLQKLLKNPAQAALINTKLTDARYKIRGATPLHFAVKHGHANLIPLLIDAGANLDATTSTSSTALHLACFCQQLQVIDVLLENGASVNCENKFGGTAFHYLAKTGQHIMLDKFLEHSSNPVTFINESDDKQRTALHLSILRNHYEFTKQLLKYKPNLSQTDIDGNTPLHLACQAGASQIIKMLLNKGLDATKTNNYHQTPLHLLVDRKNQTGLEVFLTHCQHLHEVIDLPTTQHHTALCIAVIRGNLESVSQLLAAGANVSIADNRGDSPLHIAAKNKQYSLVQLLVSHGADPKLRNTAGNKAIRGRVDQKLIKAARRGKRQAKQKNLLFGFDAQHHFLSRICQVNKQEYIVKETAPSTKPSRLRSI